MAKQKKYNQDELRHALTELAMDLHWSWYHATDKIWQLLDPVLWDLTHNPLVVLQTVSQKRITEVLTDPTVRAMIQEFSEANFQQSTKPTWFQETYPTAPFNCLAYFSMEFMLSEALPIYSGGLGNVAADHLKTASDLGIPVIGIGLLYQQGYARQVIYEDGSQQYVAPFNDPGQLPLAPLRNEDGEWLRIEVKLPGFSVWLRTWKVQVGRTKLLLLDSNDAANFPIHRGITNELYGSDAETRFLQELILGLGGLRLLKALKITPEVCHLNEGHSAFAVIERALNFMEENNLSFEAALNVTRSGNIFTTHTAIGAGFDRYTPSMIEHYLGGYIQTRLKMQLEDFLALGRQNPDDASELFNLGYLAIKGCGYVNGVSQLHGSVSRGLFAKLFPRWPVDEVPVGYVTNGVHMPTWDSPEADRLWTETCGKDRWLGKLETFSQEIQGIATERIWQMRVKAKETFVEQVRAHYSRQLAVIGIPWHQGRSMDNLLDPGALTLGFARRFVGYKRPNLLLHDPLRLKGILENKERPVQLILAGKAHPNDKEGQTMIHNWVQFIYSFEVQNKVVFLSDYDMHLTEHLVQGVDVWINTPRRPWEACGTSGMKVLVNGGLNLSTYDGWWNEAYTPEVGWVIGERSGLESHIMSDAEEAEELYQVLESQVVPEFYDRNEQGVPIAWVNRIRKSMSTLTPYFSSIRSMREYLSDYYLPAVAAYGKRAADNGKAGAQLLNWQKGLTEKWKGLRFGELTVSTTEDNYQFHVPVFLNGLALHDIQVELYANRSDGLAAVRKPMLPDSSQHTGPDYLVFTVLVSNDRPAAHFTPRIIPHYEGLSIPLECNVILWHH